MAQRRWLVKTEPDEYAYDDLEREGVGVWDGVRNATALRHLRGFTPGDEVLVYHTGRERRVVGLARVVRGAYPDPSAGDPRYVVADLAPVRRLEPPVTLAEIKADPALAACDLVRLPRLSVMPVPAVLWRRVVGRR
ncbi:MAG: EVE domain-containing protein [Candidatus Krumholzibacteriia bacterium]